MRKTFSSLAGAAVLSTISTLAQAQSCEQCGGAPPPPPPVTSPPPGTSPTPKPFPFPGQVAGFPDLRSKADCSTARKSRRSCKSRDDKGGERFVSDHDKRGGSERNTQSRKSRR